MRHDVLDQLSDGQVVTTTAAVTTNSKYKKEATQDLGVGQKQMGLIVAPTVTGVGATSWTVEMIEATDAALTTSISVLSTMTITLAEMKVGKQFFLPLPPYKMSKNYFGGRITPVGGAAQSVALDVFFGSQDDVANYKSFKSTYSVDN